MLSKVLVIWMLTGATTATWGILASTSATLMEAPAGLMPMKLLVELGRTNMCMPIPFWRVLKPSSLPIKRAEIERIMMTSMAIAKTLMRERRGRWTRLPITSLFMLFLVYGSEPLTLLPGCQKNADWIARLRRKTWAQVDRGRRREEKVMGVEVGQIDKVVMATDLPAVEAHVIAHCKD